MGELYLRLRFFSRFLEGQIFIQVNSLAQPSVCMHESAS